MSKFQNVAHVKVSLQDVLEVLDEVQESRASEVLKLGPDATVADFQYKLGVVKGLKQAIDRLQYNLGGVQVDEQMYDTRY